MYSYLDQFERKISYFWFDSVHNNYAWCPNNTQYLSILELVL